MKHIKKRGENISKATKPTVKYTTVESRTFNVYSFEDDIATFLETIEIKGGKRPNETELKKKYGIKKIIVSEVSKKKVTYECPLEDFIKVAKKVD